MEKPKVLSGEALVIKGITKIDASLPEAGLKDVTPNGSWLEQKQIQAALEARKHLIEVERIEKCGTLSHAEWRDDLMLAEVTQKSGGHWQYLGHNVGKTLYLRPEEALFLMEVNCLLLKHNEVTVSLQKAYSLLLHSSTTLIQYKVYASLSRLGYKVFRHKGPKINNKNANRIKDSTANDYENLDSPILNAVKETESVDLTITTNNSGNESENIDSQIVNTVSETQNIDSPLNNTANETQSIESPIVNTVHKSENTDSAIVNTVKECAIIDSPVVVTVDKSEYIDSQVSNTINVRENIDSPIVNTVIKSEYVNSPVVNSVNVSENNVLPEVNTVNVSENNVLPEVKTVNESENMDSPIVGSVNKSEHIDSPVVNTTNVSENNVPPEFNTVNESEKINSSVVNTVNETQNTDLPVVNTLNTSEDTVSSEVNPMDVSENIESTILNMKKELENVETPITVTDIEMVDVPKETKDIGTSENNEDREVKYSEIIKHNVVHENSDDKVTEQISDKINDQNFSTIDINTIVIDKLEATSENNAGQSDSIQVTSTVTDDSKSIDENVEGITKSNSTLPVVNTLNTSEDTVSSEVNPMDVSENIESTILNMKKELENVETPIPVTDIEMVDVPKETKDIGTSENNEDREVKYSEIIKHNVVHENSDDKVTEQISDKINDQNFSTLDINTIVIDKLEATSENNAGQSDSIQVTSTVTDNSKSIDENVEGITKSNSTSDLMTCIISHEPMDSGCETATAEVSNNLENGTTHADLAVHSGSQNIEDNTKHQVNNNDSNNIKTSNSESELSYNNKNNSEYNYLSKIEKLNKRHLKPTNSTSLEKHFENIPDLIKKQIVTVNVPPEKFIPDHIFVTNNNYLLNLRNIKKRSIRSASTESTTYTSSDEASGTNVRRIRSCSGTEFSNNPNFFPNVRFPRHLYFRPYPYWRPQSNLNFYQFNMFCQRPYTNMFFQTRAQYPPRSNLFLRSFSHPNNLNPNNPAIGNNARKRTRSGRAAQLQNIKNLAVRLKQFFMSGNTDLPNIEALHNQLHSYNMRYKTRLRLSDNFDVVNEEKILETIELDDDDETKRKKLRLDQDRDSDKYDENLYRLRQLAHRLRDLESRDKATATHRRAFSKAIKTFNKSYNADVYLNEDNYEVIDRRYITLESSSESDCVVEEQPKVQKLKSKRLRNPFNILKRRSERLESRNNPSTSKEVETSDTNNPGTNRVEGDGENKYRKLLLDTFDKTWLPNENDFGRAEVVPKQFMNARLVDSNKEQYLYDFMKDQFQQSQNWLEAKISFLRHLEETNIAFQKEQARILASAEFNTGLKPLINFEDSVELPLVLEKLRIIKNNKEIDSETSLSIHFDVYNRDVQNFKKTNPPKPHFRVICLEESSSFPPAAHVMALHSKYDDNVAIVFAIVGIGSISYLQINPIDLPVYIPSM